MAQDKPSIKATVTEVKAPADPQALDVAKAVPPRSKTNTLKILLKLNKERFGAQKLSDNNPVLRQFTRQDMQVARLGVQGLTLPDVKGEQASAEAVVNKYKTITSQQAKDNFALYSKDLKGPMQAAGEYTAKTQAFKEKYKTLIGSFGATMQEIVKQILAEIAAGKQVRNRPFVERLKAQEQSFNSMISEANTLQKEGLYLRETFRSIATRAFSTLTDKSGIEKPKPPQASNV